MRKHNTINNEYLSTIAKEIGFDLVGFAKAVKLDIEIVRLNEWLGAGHNSDMSYMERNLDKREDVSLLLNEAKSVVSLGVNYYKPYKHDLSGEKPKGKVSRYAWGKDYHYLMWEMLNTLIEKMKEVDPLFEAVSFVDTGPVMDKAWAVKAGLGWMGKNTNIISDSCGSWFFLGTIITNHEFSYNELQPDRCGTCTRCVNACPTGALSDYKLDANKCISNLTIENRGEIPDMFSGEFDNWLFGCDACQEVCPWNNKFSVVSTKEYFEPEDSKEFILEDIPKMTNGQFKNKFLGSPIFRARLKGLKRNASFLLKNKKGTE